MNRRTLLKGIAGLTAGTLILPPTLDENVEVARRYWALDRTVVAKPGPWQYAIRGPEHLGLAGWQAAAWRDRPDLPPGMWEGRPFAQREQHTTPIFWEHDSYNKHGCPQAFASLSAHYSAVAYLSGLLKGAN